MNGSAFASGPSDSYLSIMLASLGTAVLTLYGLFIGLSLLFLLGLFLGRLPELLLTAIDAVTRPVVRFAYRNAPDDLIETKCEEAFAFAIGMLVVAAMASVGSLVASIF